MSAPLRLYQQIEEQIMHHAGSALRITSARRLAALVMGILASEDCAVRRVGRELRVMGMRSVQEASTVRRLRRTLADARLDDGAGYGAAVQATVDWPIAAPVVLALDESTTPGGMHVLRLSLPYRGGCVPLSWAVWRHQEKLSRGAYWQHLGGVLARAQAILPPHLPVIVLADRAYDVPGVIDRLTAVGWDWILRVKARSQLRWRDDADPLAPEQRVRDLVGTALDRPGQRLRATGQAFKKAGWRAVNLVGEWGRGYTEPPVVLTNLAPEWDVLRQYGRRFWIEAAFRHDKSHGWDWHRSQVRDPVHQERLLLALAWASLLVLSLGAQQAAAAVTARRGRGGRWPKPTHPRDSLFRLGLGQFRAWLYGTVQGRLPWRLPHLTGPSWCAEWRALHQPLSLVQSVTP
jgi:Transposase DDE domain